MTLYPLRFEPIFKHNLWGGRRLPAFLNRTPPHDDAIGEAWVLSDVEGSRSSVANGPLEGTSLRSLLVTDPVRLVGKAAAPQGKFPLLLKFIDARQELSVQVHPNDERAARLGPGHFGKTEAWVVLDRSVETSRIYAGFAEGMTAERFRAALAAKTVPATLHSFTPNPGDCVFLEAGTVHAIGANILLFEVQQTSDITYRLYDWDRVDAKTGRPRELHLEQGLECADFARGPCPPVRPTVTEAAGVRREGLVKCRYFTLDRRTSRVPFRVGAGGECRAVVCVAGAGEIEWRGKRTPLATGDTVLLPAEVGEATCHPTREVVVLECGLPGS
jgi:mannose-6-phosphate isomerase